MMNKETTKFLIIPDVHCRDFWKKPVYDALENTDAQVIFLGDYLDGYPHEFGPDPELEFDAFNDDYKLKGIESLIEIIGLKTHYGSRITLLLGNHDCTYAISRDVCNCRTDYKNFAQICNLFKENRQLFQIAREEDINGKTFIFSHSGFLKKFFTTFIPDVDWDKYNPVHYMNNAWIMEDMKVLDTLGVYDIYRGDSFGNLYASPVWSDIRAWFNVKEDETFGFNVVGHTMLQGDKPIWFNNIICLDTKRAYYMDNEGKIYDYLTDSLIK